MSSMLLIITPSSGWRREIEVIDLVGATEAQMFEAFQKANEAFADVADRDKVNITIAHVSMAHLEAWLANNVVPNWWERLTRRYRLNTTRLVRQT